MPAKKLQILDSSLMISEFLSISRGNSPGITQQSLYLYGFAAETLSACEIALTVQTECISLIKWKTKAVWCHVLFFSLDLQ